MNLAVKRLIAQILDWIIYIHLISGIPGIILFTIFLLVKDIISNENLQNGLAILAILTFPLTYFYLSYMHIKSGQTFGYKIMKIKLVYNEGVNVSKSALVRAILRPFLGMMMLFFIIFVIYGYVLFNSKGAKDVLDTLLGTRAVEA